MKEFEASLETLGSIVDYLRETLPQNAIVFLKGDLAAGKTTLVQAIAKDKGVQAVVASPTFSLQQCYEGADKWMLCHYDLYRMSFEEFMQLGLFEEFEKSGWHMVEWGSDRLKTFLEGVGYNVCTIDIAPTDPIRRRYQISC